MKPACREIRERLVAYADGEVDGVERAEMDGHLRNCAGCAAELEELGTLRMFARGLPAPASDPLDRQAILRAARQRMQSPERFGILSRLRPVDLVTAGALAAGVVFAVLIRTDRHPAHPTSLEALTVAELDARTAGTPLSQTEMHLESIDGRGRELPREESQ
jgi:anti-sigma factor RsiW